MARANDKVLAKQHELHCIELLTETTDAVALAIQSYHDINVKRRQTTRKDLHKDYAALCSSTNITGASDYLFGDLSKLTKDISEANKLTKKVQRPAYS